MRKRVTQRSWTASTLSTQIDIHTPLSEVSLPSGPKVDWLGPLPRLWLGQTRSRRRPCQRLSGESDPIAAAKRIDPAEEDQVEVRDGVLGTQIMMTVLARPRRGG